MGHGLLGWPDDGLGFMIFGRGALAKNSRGAKLKTQGPKPFFLKILLAKFFFFGPRPPWAPLALYLGPSLVLSSFLCLQLNFFERFETQNKLRLNYIKECI